MKQLSDRVLAERMLQARERGGYRFLSYVRMNARNYVLLVLYFGAMAAVFIWLELRGAAWIVLGLIIGACLRDVRWLIGAQRVWPFSVRVIDWAKVQELADRSPAAEPDASPNGGTAARSGNSDVNGGPPSVIG